MVRRWRDHLSEGSRRREAPCSTWRPRCKVSRPRPARDLHRTPHLPAHTPRARSRAPCFHHLSPLAPLILADDARSRWSILARAKGAPAAPARPLLALPAPLPPPCAAACSAQLLGMPPPPWCPPTPRSRASFGVCAQAPGARVRRPRRARARCPPRPKPPSRRVMAAQSPHHPHPLHPTTHIHPLTPPPPHKQPSSPPLWVGSLHLSSPHPFPAPHVLPCCTVRVPRVVCGVVLCCV